jgi:hypothetical protein
MCCDCLASRNEILARHAINIVAQQYGMRSDVSYVVLNADASAVDSHRMLSEIRFLEERQGQGSPVSIGSEPARRVAPCRLRTILAFLTRVQNQAVKARSELI